MSRQEQDRYIEVLKELREIRKSLPGEPTVDKVFDKDFIYFAISMFVPIGYGETDLIPHDSIAHPIVGWICWAIPVYMIGRIAWHWMTKQEFRPVAKGSVAAIIAIGFFAGAFVALRSFVDHKNNEVQDEVSRNLSPHVLPALTENVMESVFSITNGSNKTAIGSGMLFCGINQILGDNNGVPVRIGQLSSTAVPNASRLIPGDSRSEPCLMFWSTMVKRTQCVDMTLWMRYTIEPQPAVMKEKWFRLVGYQSRGGGFNWYPEPVDSGMDYCDYFRRQTAPRI